MKRQSTSRGACGFFYWHGGRLKPGFRVLSGFLAMVFFWQQTAAWGERPDGWELQRHQNVQPLVPLQGDQVLQGELINQRNEIEKDLGIVNLQETKLEAKPSLPADLERKARERSDIAAELIPEEVTPPDSDIIIHRSNFPWFPPEVHSVVGQTGQDPANSRFTAELRAGETLVIYVTTFDFAKAAALTATVTKDGKPVASTITALDGRNAGIAVIEIPNPEVGVYQVQVVAEGGRVRLESPVATVEIVKIDVPAPVAEKPVILNATDPNPAWAVVRVNLVTGAHYEVEIWKGDQLVSSNRDLVPQGGRPGVSTYSFETGALALDEGRGNYRFKIRAAGDAEWVEWTFFAPIKPGLTALKVNGQDQAWNGFGNNPFVAGAVVSGTEVIFSIGGDRWTTQFKVEVVQYDSKNPLKELKVVFSGVVTAEQANNLKIQGLEHEGYYNLRVIPLDENNTEGQKLSLSFKANLSPAKPIERITGLPPTVEGREVAINWVGEGDEYEVVVYREADEYYAEQLVDKSGRIAVATWTLKNMDVDAHYRVEVVTYRKGFAPSEPFVQRFEVKVTAVIPAEILVETREDFPGERKGQLEISWVHDWKSADDHFEVLLKENGNVIETVTQDAHIIPAGRHRIIFRAIPEVGKVYEVEIKAFNKNGTMAVKTITVTRTLPETTPPDKVLWKEIQNDPQGNTLLNWEASKGAVRYEVFVNSVSSSIGDAKPIAVVEGTNYQVNGLSGVYNVWVRAVNAEGVVGEISEIRGIRFGVIPVPGPIQGVSAPATVAENRVTVNWQAEPNSVRYQVRAERTGGGLREYSDVTGTTLEITGLENGEWTITVVGINRAGEKGPVGAVVKVTVAIEAVKEDPPQTPPSQVTHVTAKAGAISSEIQIHWQADPKADQYHVVLWGNDGTSKILVTKGKESEVIFPEAKEGITYTIQVIGINSKGTSPLSDPVTVKWETQKPPPAQETPPTIQPLKEWTDPASGVRYQFDKDGRVSSMTTPAGKTFMIVYVGDQIQITGPDGKVEKFNAADGTKVITGTSDAWDVSRNADGSYSFTTKIDGKEFQVSGDHVTQMKDGAATVLFNADGSATVKTANGAFTIRGDKIEDADPSDGVTARWNESKQRLEVALVHEGVTNFYKEAKDAAGKTTGLEYIGFSDGKSEYIVEGDKISAIEIPIEGGVLRILNPEFEGNRLNVTVDSTSEIVLANGERKPLADVVPLGELVELEKDPATGLIVALIHQEADGTRAKFSVGEPLELKVGEKTVTVTLRQDSVTAVWSQKVKTDDGERQTQIIYTYDLAGNIKGISTEVGNILYDASGKPIGIEVVYGKDEQGRPVTKVFDLSGNLIRGSVGGVEVTGVTTDANGNLQSALLEIDGKEVEWVKRVVDGVEVELVKLSDGTLMKMNDRNLVEYSIDPISGKKTSFEYRDNDRLQIARNPNGEQFWYDLSVSWRPMVQYVAVDGTVTRYTTNPGAIVSIVKPGQFEIQNPQFNLDTGKPENVTVQYNNGERFVIENGKVKEGTIEVQDPKLGKTRQVWTYDAATGKSRLARIEVLEANSSITGITEILLDEKGELKDFVVVFKDGTSQGYQENQVVWKRDSAGTRVNYRFGKAESIEMANGVTFENLQFSEDGSRLVSADIKIAGRRGKYVDDPAQGANRLIFIEKEDGTGSYVYTLEENGRSNIFFRDDFEDGNMNGWVNRGYGGWQIAPDEELTIDADLANYKGWGHHVQLDPGAAPVDGISEIWVEFEFVGQAHGELHLVFGVEEPPPLTDGDLTGYGNRLHFVRVIRRSEGWRIEYTANRHQHAHEVTVIGPLPEIQANKKYRFGMIWDQEKRQYVVFVEDPEAIDPKTGEPMRSGGYLTDPTGVSLARSGGITLMAQGARIRVTDFSTKLDASADLGKERDQVDAAVRGLRNNPGIAPAKEIEIARTVAPAVLPVATRIQHRSADHQTVEGLLVIEPGGVRKYDGRGNLKWASGEGNTRMVLDDQGRISVIEDGQGRALIRYVFNEASGDLVEVDVRGAEQVVREEIERFRQEIEQWATGQLNRVDQIAAEKKAAIEEAKQKALEQLEADVAVEKQRIEVEIIAIDARITNRIVDAATQEGRIIPYPDPIWREEKRSTVNVFRAKRTAMIETEYQQALAELEKWKGDQQADISGQKNEFSSQLGQREEEAINDLDQKRAKSLAQFYYSRILGREPNEQEIKELARSGTVDIASLKAGLVNSPEYQNKKNLITRVTHRVVESLRSGTVPVVGGLSPTEITAIERWLQNQDLHFGSSAFVPLQGMLKHLGVNLTEEDLAVEAILAEIALGNIKPSPSMGEGKGGGDGPIEPLQISLRGLQLVAANHGKTLHAAALTLEDLRQLTKPLIVLIEGNHYVTVTEVANGVVTYSDPSIGPGGESVRLSEEKFMQKFSGYALTQEVPADSSKLLTAQQATQIKGAFFWLIFAAIAAIASVAVTVVTAVVGALSALVGLVWSFAGALVSGFGSLLGGISGMLSSLPVIGTLTQGVGGLFAGGSLLANIGLGLVSTGLGYLTQSLAGFNVGWILNPLDMLINLGMMELAEKVDFFQSSIGSVVGAFVSGGISGSFKGAATGLTDEALQQQIIKSGVTKAASQAVTEVAKDHVDGAALQLLGTIGGTVAGGIVEERMNPGGTFWQDAKSAFNNVTPDLTQALAVGGLGIVGEKNNWDPALTAGGQAALGALLAPTPRDDPATKKDESKITMNDRLVNGLAAGVATWGVMTAAEKIDAGPLGEAGLLLLGTSLANAAVQVATSDQLQAKDFGNVLGGEISESVKNIVNSTLSLGTNVDRNTPYGETVYQQKIADVAKKVKEQGLNETLEQTLTNAIQGQAIGQGTEAVTPAVRQTVDTATAIAMGILKPVLYKGQQALEVDLPEEETGHVILSEEGDSAIIAQERESDEGIGEKVQESLKNGQVVSEEAGKRTIQTQEGTQVEVTGIEEGRQPEFDQNGNLVNGRVRSGNSETVIKDGQLQSHTSTSEKTGSVQVSIIKDVQGGGYIYETTIDKPDFVPGMIDQVTNTSKTGNGSAGVEDTEEARKREAFQNVILPGLKDAIDDEYEPIDDDGGDDDLPLPPSLEQIIYRVLIGAGLIS